MALAGADDLCEGWHCPQSSTVEPTAELAPDRQGMLSSVAMLTGVRGLRTCPYWYAGLPWVSRAVRAHAWREHGELSAVEPNPSLALVQAVDLVAAGIASRMRYDAAEAKRRAGRGNG